MGIIMHWMLLQPNSQECCSKAPSLHGDVCLVLHCCLCSCAKPAVLPGALAFVAVVKRAGCVCFCLSLIFLKRVGVPPLEFPGLISPVMSLVSVAWGTPWSWVRSPHPGLLT